MNVRFDTKKSGLYVTESDNDDVPTFFYFLPNLVFYNHPETGDNRFYIGFCWLNYLLCFMFKGCTKLPSCTFSLLPNLVYIKIRNTKSLILSFLFWYVDLVKWK